MLEWLEVRLDVGDDQRLMYKCHIETLNSDRDALKQECCLARIADSGTQSPTHLVETPETLELLLPEFQARLAQK